MIKKFNEFSINEEITANTSKLFKSFYETDAKDIIKRVKELSDSDLKLLYKEDYSKSGGPQKIQMRTIEKEMKRRKLI